MYFPKRNWQLTVPGMEEWKLGISIINTEQIFFLVAHIFTTAEFHWLLDFSFSNSIPKPQLIHGMLAAILLVYISCDYCYPSFRISLLFSYLRVILATVLCWSSLSNFKKREFLRVSTISLYLGSQISCIYLLHQQLHLVDSYAFLISQLWTCKFATSVFPLGV